MVVESPHPLGVLPDREVLRRLPRRALLMVLVVEAAAVGVVLASLSVPSRAELTLALLLTGLSLLHTELATGIERIRRRDAESSYFDLSSVWTFAAAVLLPPALAAGVIVVIYLHLWFRVWRPAGVAMFRHVYTTATVLLAAVAARAVVTAVGGLPAGMSDVAAVSGIALAVLVYLAVNTTLVAVAIALSGKPIGPSRAAAGQLIGRWDDNALEVATICMGALAAVALSTEPGLIVLVLPPVLVLHRAVLVRQLEQEASTDAKTGLLNLAAWRDQAARTLLEKQRAGGAAAVLILDLDYFKAVNDVYGHLGGDEVLAAVAAQLRDSSRTQDLVGRFGGEEFVVLLRDLPPGVAGVEVLWSVAERIRTQVSQLRVTVNTPGGPLTVTRLTASVGGALLPTHGSTLDQVLRVADASLYTAKRSGRNQVRIATARSAPAVRRAAS